MVKEFNLFIQAEVSQLNVVITSLKSKACQYIFFVTHWPPYYQF